MRTHRGATLGRRLLPLVVLAALAALVPASALADVSAYRASDGSSDPAFVTIGRASMIRNVVPDGTGGAYLIGSIAYGGAGHRMVHMRADGSVDPVFKARITAGFAAAGALSGGKLAVVGAFTAVNGQPRRGLAILDARTGRTLPWTPLRPHAARMETSSRVIFAGGMLIASTYAGIFAWREGAVEPAWKNSRVFSTEPASPTSIVLWRGRVWALAGTRETGDRLISMDPATGRVATAALDVSHVSAIDGFGGRLIVVGQGEIGVLLPGAKAVSTPACVRALTKRGRIVTAAGGNTGTLYLGEGPTTFEAARSITGVVACSTLGAATAFHAPGFASTGPHGQVVQYLAAIGTHVLVFTRRF
jgi:hypothetical protein